MLEAIDKYKGFDLIMFDSALADETGNVTKPYHYKDRNTCAKMGGGEFLIRQEIPWSPWHYLYRRSFLTDNNFRFQDQVRFEDQDFVMRCTANARQMVFIPSPAIVHTVSSYQTTAVGNSFEKIRDLIFMSHRTGKVALEEAMKGNADVSRAIMGHHNFGYVSFVKRYLWRLHNSQIKQILKDYPPITNQESPVAMRLMYNHPKMSAMFLTAMHPFLTAAYRIYSKRKRR